MGRLGPAPSSEGVTGGDAQQPGPQRSRIAERPDTLPGGHHGVEHDLLGIGVAVQDVEGDALKQASVFVEQALERLRMPCAQVVDQLLVQLTPAAISTDTEAPTAPNG